MSHDKPGELKVTFFKDSMFAKDWYLETWFEKILFVLGFVALAWTLIQRAFFGSW